MLGLAQMRQGVVAWQGWGMGMKLNSSIALLWMRRWGGNQQSPRRALHDYPRTVSSSLGVNNRGVMVDDELAVLKPTVTDMNAVLVEAARLSGTDETKLHTSGSVARIAAGIKAALDESLGN